MKHLLFALLLTGALTTMACKNCEYCTYPEGSGTVERELCDDELDDRKAE